MIEYYSKPKKSKKKLIIWLVIIVLLSALGVFGYTYIEPSDTMIVKTISQEQPAEVFESSRTMAIPIETSKEEDSSGHISPPNTDDQTQTHVPLDQIMFSK